MPGSPNLAFFIHGLTGALPSSTQGRSPVPKLGTPGSVRGVFSNGHPYRDRAMCDSRRPGAPHGRPAFYMDSHGGGGFAALPA